MDNNSDRFDAGSQPAGLIQLRVTGISYSQVQTGIYALILSQAEGPFRIPVMIGAAEAQAIAMNMEGVRPPRPMTHDLIVSTWKAFGIRPVCVLIYKFEDGIFYSELRLADSTREITVDSRTSDAVAIAMRTGAPIYTTPEVLAETGFEMEIHEVADDGTETVTDEEEHAPADDRRGVSETRLENYAIEELERTLAGLIERENYEEAARVSEILRRKRARRDGDGNE